MKSIFILLIISISAASYAQDFRQRAKGRSFNPQIGINANFLDQNSSRDGDNDGISLNEVEMQFTSDIDTYFAGTILLGIEKEDSGEFAISPEEVFVETISLPAVTLKIGKSKMPIGKHNQLHPHAYPFVNGPLVNESVLGEEGLTEVGYGISGLLPFSWFSEFTFNYVQGENDELYNSDRKNNRLALGRLKNLWDLNESTTLEVGMSAAKGENKIHGKQTSLTGIDLTLKWRPIKGGKYSAFEWGAEYLRKDKEGDADPSIAGVVSHLKYQFKQRWYAQYRYDYLDLGDLSSTLGTQRHTALLAFIPSEFSAFRIQYENIDDEKVEDEKRLSLQMIISIGAHPAHTY